MASSRGMRKSPRNASPMNTYTNGSSTPEVDLDVQRDEVNAGESWREPPLREAPSFQDYKGLERHGVLEQMQPLGTMPTQKVKLRIKPYDPNRKSQLGRNGETVAAPKEQEAQVAEPSSSRRRSESRKVEERATNKSQTSAREKDTDRDYTPKPQGATSARARSASNRTVPQMTPNSKTPAGQEAMKNVVQAAVQRAREIGNEKLGLAVQKLFEESLTNRTLADLLDAVLSQKPTPRQALDFQAYIKEARKQLKSKSSTSKPNSKSSSRRESVSRSLFPPSSKPEKTSPSAHRKPHQANGDMVTTNGNDISQPPTKKIKRSSSVSSASSLSSTHSTELEPQLDPDIAAANEPNGDPSVNSRGRPVGPKLHTFRAGVTGAKRQSGATPSSSTNKRPAETVEDPEDPELVELAHKKRKLRKTFDDYDVIDSEVRAAPSPVPPTKGKAPPPTLPAVRTGATPRNAKEEAEELRSPASSTFGEFLVPPPPGALRSSRSRGTTPNALGRPKNAVRKGARVKMSPMKKKNGVVAGIARQKGAKEQAAGEVSDHDGEGENVDYCTSCGGNGELLCCDGCTRSFHFRCLDPPLDNLHPPEGEWLCFACEARRHPQKRPTRGLFASMQYNLNKRNTDAYSLPTPIRDYFDGVKTGEEGEYEEVTAVKNKVRSAAAHDDAHDNFKLKDPKTQEVPLCFKCGKSSLGHREMIGCDYCTLKWHLDCLDPPMANPPALNRPSHRWMCPAHVDQELLSIGHSGRLHKVRRPKNAKVVNTFLHRGFKNNGIIEIENELSDSENELEVDDSVVYRVSERGLKLDFIDRVKRSNEEAARQRAVNERYAREKAEREASVARESQRAFNARSFIEKETALNLAKFAQADANFGLDKDQVQNLVNTLVMEAPDKVVAMCYQEDEAQNPTGAEKTPPTPPTSDPNGISEEEMKSLILIQELVRRRLEAAAAAQSDMS